MSVFTSVVYCALGKAENMSGSSIVDASSAERTTSLTRSLRHLDMLTWMTYIALSAAVRTVLQHPLNLATARRRVHRDNNVTVRGVLRDTYNEAFRASAQSSAAVRRARAVRAMYRGLGVAIVGNVVGECAYLGTLEVIREHFPVEHATVRDGIGGASGDALSLVLCTPLSVLCNRQMTAGVGMAADNKYEGAAASARTVVGSGAQRRLRGLYAGFGASLYVLPASATWWMSYGAVKHAMYGAVVSVAGANNGDQQAGASGIVSFLSSSEDNPLLNGAAGATASLVTVGVFNPFTVVRTRLQVLAGSPALAASELEHAGTWYGRSATLRVCADLLRHEGPRAFWKGTSANVLMAVVDGIIFSNVYELTKWYSDHTFNAPALKN
jgi:hypothetical protein